MIPDLPESSLDRRGCLRAAGAVTSATALGLLARTSTASQPEESETSPPVGVHIASHSFYDEGIEHCLDFVKETAGVNMLFVTSIIT